MSLIYKVKKTKTAASKVYATVEMTMLGVATVRLKGSSKRMTNLPIFGGEVSVGDTVVVDYSGEGKPFVRKAIEAEPVTRLGTNVIETNPTVKKDDGFLAGKFGLLQDTTFEDTVEDGQFTWIKVAFDKTYYDIPGLWQDHYMGQIWTGQYILNLTLAFSTQSLTASGYCGVDFMNYKASTGATSPKNFMMPYIENVEFFGENDENVHIINISTLARISEPDNAIGVVFFVYTTGYIYPVVLSENTVFSIHKLNNLDPVHQEAMRGWWDSGGVYI